MAAKRKGGRPRVPKDQRRDRTMTVRFSTEEMDRIAAQARAEGLDSSVWVRRVAILALGPL